MRNDEDAKLQSWVDALEQRHMAGLRVQEISRALRALSANYVERRARGARQHVHGALESAGKRAAFALYYAPLHFMAVAEVVRALGQDALSPSSIVDLGCGTGAAGAAWALSSTLVPAVTGLDRHPWAVAEARWTLRHFGLQGPALQADVGRLRPLKPGTSVIAAYTLNEIADENRRLLEDRLIDVSRLGGHVLIIEPLARGVTPWWPETAARVIALGGRADEWRLSIEPPPLVAQLGTAAGLTYREMKLRSLFL